MEEYLEDTLLPSLQTLDDQKGFIFFLEFLKKVIIKQKQRGELHLLWEIYRKIAHQIKHFLPNAYVFFNILLKLYCNLQAFEQKQPKRESKMILRRILTQELQNNEEDKETSNNITQEQLQIIEDIREDFWGALDMAVQHVSSDQNILLFADFAFISEFVQHFFEDKNINIIVVLKDNQQVQDFPHSEHTKNIVFIQQESLFSVLSRVQKVFMDCYAVLNDGSVISNAGGYNVALLAKEFNVPLFVISPQFKFTPLYIFSQDGYNLLERPQNVLSNCNYYSSLLTQFYKYNLIQFDLVTILITEIGEFSTNYVHKIFQEYYNDDELQYNSLLN